MRVQNKRFEVQFEIAGAAVKFVKLPSTNDGLKI